MFIMILHFDITNITAITIIRFSRLDGGVERDKYRYASFAQNADKRNENDLRFIPGPI